VVIRVRRQITSQVNTPAIQELVAWRNGHQHHGVTVLCDADHRGSLNSTSRQNCLSGAAQRQIAPALAVAAHAAGEYAQGL
jgi:hypothetical protein